MIDEAKCSYIFTGAEKVKKGEEGNYMENSKGYKPSFISPFYRKPRNLYNTGQAVCGARGCTRACMISLESRGVLQNSFKEKFRRRPTWEVDWSKEPEYAEGTQFRPEKIIGDKAD